MYKRGKEEKEEKTKLKTIEKMKEGEGRIRGNLDPWTRKKRRKEEIERDKKNKKGGKHEEEKGGKMEWVTMG